MSETESSSASSSEGDFIPIKGEVHKEGGILDLNDFSEEELALENETIDLGKEFETVPPSFDSVSFLRPFGVVQSRVEGTLVVKATMLAAILDLGTWVAPKDSPLIIGIIWDVFGPVEAPFYSVLLRDPTTEGTIPIGSPLFIDARKSNIVSKAELMQNRGVDAEAKDGVEFSDDDEESKHRKNKELGGL